jgi:hypothetical protein
MTDKNEKRTVVVDTILVSYNNGNPTAKPAPASVYRGSNLTFQCNDATLVVVCQYHETGTKRDDHCPFAPPEFIFTVAKGSRKTHKVRDDGTVGNFEYSLAVVPDDGPKVKTLDPTIIILQTM